MTWKDTIKKNNKHNMQNDKTIDYEEPFICPECGREGTKSKNSQVCTRCEDEYQSGRNPPMRVPWPN
tara:strand:+ start:93 stop:293 length:201 start_codon:yes stop_codon:yes gene_type:complete